MVHAPFPTAYVLTLRGTVDANAGEDLEADFARATSCGLRLIVDLGSLEHGDETLLGLLLDARPTGGLDLVGPLSPSLQRRLHTAGLADWFTIQPTLTAALHH
ncbi:STAS domain-containing protein [Kitasatospora fiedleri]|uniref:STAS domain-containing protein n=1 Tax=Kitasatospora fiedleri TaxID=2991545 RepID=UPI00249B519C|nr:STAS domain-containing protein [Kitasatospora fiedleri]